MGPVRRMVRPILPELLKDLKIEDRLRSLELQVSQGAECNSRFVEDVVKTVEETKQIKLEIECLSDMKSAVVRMEEVLGTKADQKVVDEMEQTFKVSTRRMTQFLNQKVELSSLSFLEEQVQNMANLIPAQDDLQYNIDRNRDLLKQTNDNLKSLQEVVAGKAEKSTVEELASSISSSWKPVHPFALAELEASSAHLEAAVRDLQQKLEFKVEAMGISEIRAALESKADRQELQEMAMMSTDRKEFQDMVTSLQIFKKVTGEQADIADLKLQKMEALINQRGDHGVSDLHEDVTKLKDQLLQKADSRTLEEMVAKLKDQLSQKADSHALEEVMKTVTQLSAYLRQNAEAQSSVECALEKLRQEHLDKANSEDVAKKFDEVGLRFESIAGKPGMKLGRINEVASSTSPAGSTLTRSMTTSPIGMSVSVNPSASRFTRDKVPLPSAVVPLPSAVPHIPDNDAPSPLTPAPVSARPVTRMKSTAIKDLCKNPPLAMAEQIFHAGSVVGA